MALESLRKQFAVTVGAGGAAIRINTDELDDAIATVTEVAKKYGWELRVWDHVTGTIWYNNAPDKASAQPTSKKAAAMEALNQLGMGAPPGQGGPIGTLLDFMSEMPRVDSNNKEVLPVVLLMLNFHLVFDKDRASAVAAVQHIVRDKVADHPRYKEVAEIFAAQGIEGKDNTGKFIVGMMPAEAKLPPEVRPLFAVINHQIPDEEEMAVILDGVIPDDDEDDGVQVSKVVRKKVCKHALGLTRLQAEGAFSAALVQFGNKEDFEELLPKFVWEYKSSVLNEEGLVNLYGGKENFDDVVGQTGLKMLLKDLMAQDELDPDNPDLRSKGLALVGPPRTGKSLTAKACGNTLGVPVLMVDIGSWFGGIVGESEAKTRKGFQIIRAHAPCIAVIDEVEKVMPSAKGGEHDSGVGKRMAGTFMSQLQDIEEQVFWIFTANGVEDLHEAFLADDRVDGVVYVHMPGPAQLAAGWKMYLKKFFPTEVKGKVFNRHLETDFNTVLAEYSKLKKADVVAWANKFIATLLCVAKDERADLLSELEDHDSNIHQIVLKQMIDDDGWTIARVKACCRLSRKRKKSLAQIARMMPRGSTKLQRAINRLEKWACEEAIDAETGEAYEPAYLKEAVAPTKATKHQAEGTPVRRKVRKITSGE